MTTGIAMTLAVLAFIAVLLIHIRCADQNAQITRLRKRVQRAEAAARDAIKQLDVVRQFDARINQIRKVSEENASKLTQLSIGRR